MNHYSVIIEGYSYFRKEVGTDGSLESGDWEIRSGRKCRQIDWGCPGSSQLSTEELLSCSGSLV